MADAEAPAPSMLSNVDDLIFSFFLFGVSVLVCNIMREIILRSGQFVLTEEYKIIIAECIGTMESAVICFELNFIIMDAFGVYAYTFLLFASLIWQSARPDDYQYDANPLIVVMKHMESINSGEDSYYERFEFVTAVILSQAFGALMAYNFLMGFAWRNADLLLFWKNMNYHLNRYETVTEWQASISGFPVFAAFVEGFFSFAQYLWPTIVRLRLDGKQASVATDAGKAIFSGCGALYTGGYYNPIMASALEWNTIGYPTSIKVGIYWLAPILGTILGMAVRKLF